MPIEKKEVVKEQPRPSSTSSSYSNNGANTNKKRQQQQQQQQQQPSSSEQAALAALIAQSGLQMDGGINMAELGKVMEQEKLLQAMMMAGGMPPGLDPAMMSALAGNPFLFGGGASAGGFTPPSASAMSPQVSGTKKLKEKGTGFGSGRKKVEEQEERDRSVSPASSITSNVSQKQQQAQQQADFGMLMAMMGGGIPGMPGMIPPMGLGGLMGRQFAFKIIQPSIVLNFLNNLKFLIQVCQEVVLVI